MMSCNNQDVSRWMTGIAGMCLLTFAARAADGIWNGTQDAFWTNSANWGASPFPSGSQTATFANDGNGRTEINIAGLPSLKNMLFTSVGVSAYTIGANGTKAQTLVLEKQSEIRLDATAGNSVTFNANLQMGTDATTTTNVLRNESISKTLTVAGDILVPASGGTPGYKYLSVYGPGKTVLSGNYLRNGRVAFLEAFGCELVIPGSNHVTRLHSYGTAGSNVFDIGNGYLEVDNTSYLELSVNQDGSIVGTGLLRLRPYTGDGNAWCYVGAGKTFTINVPIASAGGLSLNEYGTGTLVLAGENSIVSNIVFNAGGTISVSVIGNRGSTGNNLGQGESLVFNANGGRLLYTGAGETSDRYIAINNNATLDQSGTGALVFSSDLAVGGTVKTLTLQGSAAGTGEIAGAIGPGASATSLAKQGSGTWRLTGGNTYAGTTVVSDGTLIVAGSAGALAATSAITINTATLRLENSAVENHANRLKDSAPLTMRDGTLAFAHTAGAASYSESVGALTIISGTNIVATSQAADGQTSTLTLASLVHASGTLDFSGEGLGESDRNRIFVGGLPDGVIGHGATVNNTSLAAYSSARGVYAVSEADYANLAARGPDPDSIIPDNAAVLARINLAGTAGPMTLAGAWSNRVGLLLQNTEVEAVVAMIDGVTNKTLLTGALQIAPDKASLKIGQNAGEGLLMPLTEGGDLLLANHAMGALLTVNAVVTNNAGGASLTKAGAGNVTIAGPVRHTGATFLGEGALTLASAADQALPGIISGAGSLAKTGGGILMLSGDNTFTGELLVSTGTVVVGHSNALGPNGAGTVIASGATLDVGGLPTENTVKIQNETITVSGAGTDGNGALVNTSANEQRVAFYNGALVRLAGNTTVNVGNRRFGFWPDSASEMLELNGHTLTKIGPGLFSLVYAGVNPGDGHFDIQEGALMLAYDSPLNGSETNTLTLRNGAALQLYQTTDPFKWTLALKDRSTLLIVGAVPRNVWAGPVTLDGAAFVDGGNLSSYSLLLSGPISGAGSLVNDDPLTAYLTYTNNTFTGGAIVSNGVLHAAHAGSLPGYSTPGKVWVAPAGMLTVLAGDGTIGWSRPQIDTLRDVATFVTTNATLGIDTSLGDWTYDSGIAQAFSLAKYGTNTLTLAGTTAVAAQLRAHAGLLNLAGTGTHTANAVVLTGSAGTELMIATPLTIANYGSLICGSVTNDRCILRITTNLTITSGSATTRGKLYAGFTAGAAGTVIQSGGLASISDKKEMEYSDAVSVGYNGSHGYYRMTGGKLSTWYMSVSGSAGNDSSVGVFDLMNGVVEVTGGFLNVGHFDGIGVVNLFGGSFATKANRVYITQTASRGTFGMLNLLGPDATFDIFSNLEMAAFIGNKASVCNLNSGRLRFQNVSVATNGTPTAVSFTPTYFNFNGGTLQAKISTTIFMPNRLTAATVYPGGAMIDSAGFNVTVAQPLVAPVGYGVTSIALASGGSGYIGAPAVQVNGGSGSNATAVALVDLEEGSPTCGRVTNILVTSAGFGYGASDTLTASLHGGGFLMAAKAGTVVKSLNTSGGLTKLGAGILTLGGTNTYAGATLISNGVIKLANAKALPTGTTIVMAGGTLDLGGYTVTNTLSGTSGTVSNGTLQATFSPAGTGMIGSDTFTPGTAIVKGRYLADVALDGTSDLLTIQGSVNLANFSLELVNPALLARNRVYTLARVTGTRSNSFTLTNLPDSRWHVTYSSDGTVSLVFVDGTLFQLR